MYRIPAVIQKRQTQGAVVVIHVQRITLDDAMGKRLPFEPSPETRDATIAGVDVNNNGIRDDVELTLFKKYPNSVQVRAAELQYALTEQMFLTRVSNTETWKAVSEENARAQLCIIDNHTNRKEVEDLVFNTAARVKAREKAYDFITSYGPEPGEPCDISNS